MTKVTLETSHGTCSITVLNDDLNALEMSEQLLRPILLAAGYHPDSVKEVFECDLDE